MRDGTAVLGDLAATGREATNATRTGNTFFGSERTVDVPPTAVSHFDDVIRYMTLAELVGKAGLGARDWGASASLPLATAGSSTFNRATVEAAVGVAVNNNTFDQSLTFGAGGSAVSVQAFGSSARDISFTEGARGSGIGTIGGGSTSATNATVNSASDEFLRFNTAIARSLGITLVDFGTSGGATRFERVRFTFYLSGTQVGSQIIKAACQNRNPAIPTNPAEVNYPGSANFSLSPGGNFNRVDVEPITTTSGDSESAILVGSFRVCTSLITTAECISPTRNIDEPDNLNDCP
ncbi:hypothetical protein [Usitatibacter palustris]|nr:hypothetical protein [Usitatibacter palustris]